MSSVQGAPPPATPNNSDNGNNNPNRKKEAERNGDDFSQALDEKTGRGAKGEREKSDNLEDLLRQAHGMKKEAEGATIAAENVRALTSQANRSGDIQALDNKAMIDKIEKIADRIMVSNAADVKAVKVDFKDGVLPGTEAMIRKDATGRIHIEFTTTSAESMNLLSRGEQTLTETLNRKLGGDIVVDIKMNAGGEQDTGDGRSRQQYMGDEDDSDNRDD